MLPGVTCAVSRNVDQNISNIMKPYSGNKVSTNTMVFRSCFVGARLSVPVPCKVVLLLRIVQVEEGVALPDRNKLPKYFREIYMHIMHLS